MPSPHKTQDPLDLLEELLDDESADEASSTRRPGPATPIAVRQSGEEPWATVLAEAVAASGRIQRATHGFHTYPAGLHPDAAQRVLQATAGPVHDPFCGGGTVLVEAALAGRPASGTDLSPIALLVARARTSPPALAGALRAASRRLAAAARLRTETEIPEIVVDWYEPHVAAEIGRLRDGIANEAVEVRPLLKVVLSSICVKASFRESDTSNARVPHHRPPGTTAILFHKKARELARMMEALPAEPVVRLRRADARKMGPPPGTGLILTSPPYPGVYDYLPMQQLRYAWLEMSPAEGYAAEVGSRRSFRAMGRTEALRVWREDTAAWIRTQVEGLAAGGHFVVVVGDGLVGDRPVDTLSPTIDAMRTAGLTILARASADRPDYARNTLRTEHMVAGQK
jgi:hypothetical protein